MNSTQRELLTALKAVLNNEPTSSLSDDILEEARQQEVYSLVCSKSEALIFIAGNVQLLWEQQELEKILTGIHYIVLKGASASIYYPIPLRRTMGDIDLLVRQEDYEKTKNALASAGYVKGIEDHRHIHFYKDKVAIELHRRFATLQSVSQENKLDTWILESPLVDGKLGKYTFPMLEDHLNGLVILTHINQHLEGGIGLRHILDWIMYVNHSLSDSEWPAFREKSDLLGLTKLAKVTAKLGQMYLGLSDSIHWCSDISEETVGNLLEYVYECGNFGHKEAENNTVIMILSHGRGLRGFFKNLQRQGESNWKALNEKPYLKPIAWIYQLGRYIYRGIKSGGVGNLRKNINSSIRRNRLLDDLGATRLAFRTEQPRETSKKGNAGS